MILEIPESLAETLEMNNFTPSDIGSGHKRQGL